MIKVVAAHAAHLDLFTPKAVFEGESAKETIKAYLQSSRAYMFTLVKENEILGIIGVVQLWPGVIDSVTLLSDSIKKCGKEFSEKVMQVMLFLEKQLKAHRNQCLVRATDGVAVIWIERLGFKREGLAEMWGPGGEDYFMYARTKKNGGIANE